MRNRAEQNRQMRERSGPEYEKAVTRSREASAVWNAEGRPAAISAALVPVKFTERDGQRYGVDYETRYYLRKSMRRETRDAQGCRRVQWSIPDQWVEATPEQITAWHAYTQNRPAFPRAPSQPATGQEC